MQKARKKTSPATRFAGSKRPSKPLKEMSGAEFAAWERSRDLGAEILAGVKEIMSGGGKRYFVSVSPIAGARLKAGLSQARFAALLGVSKRTLQQWEQGRRKPSGAARTLLKVVQRHPEVLRDLAA